MAGGIHPPLSVLQEWAKIANPSNPSETRGWGLAIMCIILFILTSAFVTARLFARFVVRQTAGIDDVVIVAAMIPTIGLAVATALGSRLYGFNRHAYDLSPEMAVNSRKVTLAIETCYIMSTGLTKISILLFYRRMSAGSISTTFRFIVHASIASVIAYMVAFILVGCLGCKPLSAFWDQANVEWARTHIPGETYQCVNEGAVLLSASAISIVQDFLACGLPMALFWKLQLPKRQKIALGGIFGVGFFLCITGILRMYYIHQIFYETYDVTWAAWEAWLWTCLEAHIAIICASAPALKTFVKRYLKSWSSMSRSRIRGTHSYAYGGGHGSESASKIVTANKSLQRSRVLELGGISVTRSVDVDSRSISTNDGHDRETISPGEFSDEEALKPELPADRYQKTSWLRIDHPRLREDI